MIVIVAIPNKFFLLLEDNLFRSLVFQGWGGENKRIEDRKFGSIRRKRSKGKREDRKEDVVMQTRSGG